MSLNLQNVNLKQEIMNKRWIKNGVFASNTIVLNGCAVSNPTDLQLIAAGYEIYVEPVLTNEEKLEQAKQNKKDEIEAYDKSPNVNGVYINGILIPWSDGEKSSLNRNTRMSVRNSTEIAKNAGLESTTLWLGDMKIDIDCDKALKLLDALEMYAMSCFNVTAAHKKAVSELKTIKEVEAFDVTADYPKQLEMKL
jgi:hypothetical protein